MPASFYFRSITIDHTKVTASQTNFPVLISGTYPELRYTGFGGHAAFTDGRDIAVYSDSAFATLLDFEIERYVPSTGEIDIWVRIPALSSTSDTVVYLKYGDSTTTVSLANPSGVWSSGFAAVYHFGESDPGQNSYYTARDATGNGNGATANHFFGSMTSGPIGNALTFDNSNPANPFVFLSVANSASLSPAPQNGRSTASLWVNADAGAPILNWGSINVTITGTHNTGLRIRAAGSGFTFTTPFTVPAGIWHHVSVTCDGSTVSIYVDGALEATTSSNEFMVGSAHLATDSSIDGALNGSLDETRLSTVARSSTWVATEYNNQSSPSTFSTVAAEIPFGPQSFSLTGIPTGQAMGVTPTITTSTAPVTLSGITSAEAFGLATTGGKILFNPIGITSAEVFGNFRADRTLTIAGITSAEAFGSIVFSGATVEVSLTGISSSETFGSVSWSAAVALSPATIASVEALGALGIVGNATFLALTSIASTESFGSIGWSTDLGEFLNVVGLASQEAFGAAPSFSGATSIAAPTGIGTSEAFGNLTLTFAPVLFVLTGIPGEAALGAVKIDQFQRVPTVIWTNPAPMDLGVPLGLKQLDAHCDDTLGTFTYNPPAGTILPAGLQRLAVAFTPNSPLWTTAFASVLVQVGEEVTAPAKTYPVNLRYRRLDSDGDYVLTGHPGDFHFNTPAAVAQACRTRLLLFAGEWFLDSSAGVPWSTEILGVGRTAYDTIIRETLLATPGVTQITAYSSSVDAARRTLTIDATIDTLYGGQVSLSIPIAPATTAPITLIDVPPAAPPASAITMRVRKMDADGDYVLTGHSQDYWVNSAAGVAQVVKTRLLLWLGEWHLDASEGTPWLTGVLGKNQQVYNAVLKDRILSSPGVTGITSYSSTLDDGNRSLAVTVGLETLYGQTALAVAL